MTAPAAIQAMRTRARPISTRRVPAPKRRRAQGCNRRHLSSGPKGRYLGSMNTDDVLAEFRGAGALREGHFILASGRHSPMFLQKNLVFQYPDRTARLCKALAEKIEAQFGKPDVIVSPAVGAIIPGYETARWLGVPALYVEREDGKFRLRRAFRIERGAKVVVVEDVSTTVGPC